MFKFWCSSTALNISCACFISDLLFSALLGSNHPAVHTAASGIFHSLSSSLKVRRSRVGSKSISMISSSLQRSSTLAPMLMGLLFKCHSTLTSLEAGGEGECLTPVVVDSCGHCMGSSITTQTGRELVMELEVQALVHTSGDDLAF